MEKGTQLVSGLAEAGGYLVAYAQAGPAPVPALRQAFELIDAAIQRDPYNTTLHRQKLRMCRRAFDVTGDRTYLQAAVGPARRVIELYPHSPSDHAALGSVLLEAGRQATDAKLLAQSVEHLTRALVLDDARPEWEELRRFHPRQRRQIETDLAAASRLLGDRP